MCLKLGKYVQKKKKGDLKTFAVFVILFPTFFFREMKGSTSVTPSICLFTLT